MFGKSFQMPVSVLSVVLDADWEVAAAFSKITICEIELLTLPSILNITERRYLLLLLLYRVLTFS